MFPSLTNHTFLNITQILKKNCVEIGIVLHSVFTLYIGELGKFYFIADTWYFVLYTIEQVLNKLIECNDYIYVD